MAIARDGTWDDAIHASVLHEYPTLPAAFAPGEVVVDLGCHTGSFCVLAAERGATVIGYEANRENHALAAINTVRFPSVRIRHAAVWRSDRDTSDRREPLQFTPSSNPVNTGGGSVLFDTPQDHWSAVPEGPDVDGTAGVLSIHPVATVALDDVLTTTGPVRFLKLDVEGAEFPILLTSRRLDLVEEIAGEYHEFTAEMMEQLVADARVGDEVYRPDLLRRTLESAGFVVTIQPGPNPRLGWFTATRAATSPRGR